MSFRNKFTDRELKKLVKTGRYADGEGLYIQVSRFGTRSWIYRYSRDGKERQKGLGAYPKVSLKKARQLRDKYADMLIDGLDPIEVAQSHRTELKQAREKKRSFKSCAEQYIETHRSGWKNPVHAKQWPASLETYVYPIIGATAVDEIKTSDILRVLDPIWHVKTETASRIRQRIERILAWATVRGFRSGDNPARWRGYLKEALPERASIQKTRPHSAMPYSETPAFVGRLRARNSISARALEFTILTAARTGEVINAEWSEFDLESSLWIVPAKRMKASREHYVPLSSRACEILAELPRDGETGEFVFPGLRAGHPLSNMAMLKMLRSMTDEGFTVHGFRSSFRDWAGEQTNFARDVIEAALAHQLKDKTEAAYRRLTAVEKRRRLMDAWAKYLAKLLLHGSIVPINQSRHAAR